MPRAHTLNLKNRKKIVYLLLITLILSGITIFFLFKGLLSFTDSHSDTTSLDSENSTLAYLQTIRQNIKKNGPENTWRMLINKKDSLSKDGFHDAAHIVGQELFKKDGLTSLTICSPAFFYGCYHGVIEEYVKSKGISHITELKEYCEAMESGVAIPCFHGLGHGFLSYYKYQLNPALDECHEVLTGSTSPYCYQGVFMEYITTFPMKSTDNDPFGICQKISADYKLACFNYFIIYHAYFDDVQALEVVCQKNMSRSDTAICMEGLGISLSHVRTGYPQQIEMTCNQLSEKNKKICLISSQRNNSDEKY